MNWEQAVEKFIDKWKREGAKAIILTGSFAHSSQNQFSDIDLIIVLSQGCGYKERGICKIEGFLIEYFANPVKEIRTYFKKDFINGKNTFAHMVAKGKILFDPNGIALEIQKEAKKMLKKTLKPLSDKEIEMAKYFLWDDMTNLKALAEDKNPTYIFNYSLLLKRTIDTYYSFKQLPILPPSKFFEIIKNKNHLDLKIVNDDIFNKLTIVALEEDDVLNLESLINYVLKKMGGFPANNWKIRTIL